jgi:asparagine synthase (glutamine-hydrolysing)
MCGIAGFIDPQLNLTKSHPTLDKMLQAIAHRGPDSRGTYFEGPLAFGHNRLAIIDLSADGNQPMEYFDSVIVFNGEIYNYIEVREQLIRKGYHFKTKSDTEVILAAYREYGTQCVNHFIGMWAFVLWDKKEQLLFCSNDRFGIKPFYYIHLGDRFYFGSEYKALKQSPLFTNDVNLDQVSRGLQLGWIVYQDETYFNCLKILPAASNLIFKNAECRIEKYWDIDFTRKSSSTFEEKKYELRELFRDSISLHMRSDVEVAICLSGGIDSSGLSSFMSVLYPQKDLRSFSIYYDGKNEVDERPFIKAVTDRYSNIKPNLYKPEQDEIIGLCEEIFYSADVPASGSSFMSHYYLVKEIAKKNVKVVLDGQGSDEYLGGYMHSMYRAFADELTSMQIGKFGRDFSLHASNQNLNSGEKFDVLGKSIMSVFSSEQRLYEMEYKHYFPGVLQYKPGNIPFHLNHKPANKLTNFLFHLLGTTSLPTILHYVDRMTMAHSVESRVPFLDHRLVELAFSFSNDDKINRGTTKYVLREALKNELPPTVYERKDKKGFVTPGETNWLRKPLRKLLNIDYSNFGHWNKEKTEKIINEYLAGNNRHAKLVWRIATLNHWLKNI